MALPSTPEALSFLISNLSSPQLMEQLYRPVFTEMLTCGRKDWRSQTITINPVDSGSESKKNELTTLLDVRTRILTNVVLK